MRGARWHSKDMSRATNNKTRQSGVVQFIEQLRPREAVDDEKMKIEN